MSSMNVPTRRVFDLRWWMLAACIGCLLAYLRGLGGDFLFDDIPNIVANPAMQGVANGKPDWLAVAFLTGSGLLRRPISMLSFGLNIEAFGMSPYAFKVVNLIVHLLNGVVLFALFRRIADRLTPAVPISRAHAVALIAASVWLLHPLQVSSVLYIVQRMNLLATLFTLLGLLCYVEGRLRMLRGESGLPVSIAGVCVFGLLAVFCKENGALIVVYALAIEWLCFHFDASKRERWTLRGFFVLTVAVPIALYAIYLMIHPQSLAYSRNGFTLYTRLLSEARVLCDYLVWIFVPAPSLMGMYHDDIAVSSGVFSPITTAVSIVFLATLCASAWLLRKRLPAFTFGVAWFLIGHSIESTIIPLELVFEHRNYLPMAGPLLALVCMLASVNARHWPSPRALAVCAGLAIAVLAGVTTARANNWSSALSLALTDAGNHPLSARSQYDAGRAITVDGAKRGDLAGAIERAKPYIVRAAELDPKQIYPRIALIRFRGTTESVPAEEISDLAKRLRNADSNEQANPFLEMLVAASNSKLALTPSDVSTLVEAALANPFWRPQVRAMMLNDYGAYQFNIVRNPQEAIRLTRQATAIDSVNPYFELNLAKIALAIGDKALASEHLDAARRLNKLALYDKDIDDLQEQLAR
jgi:hypothetical protein